MSTVGRYLQAWGPTTSKPKGYVGSFKKSSDYPTLPDSQTYIFSLESFKINFAPPPPSKCTKRTCLPFYFLTFYAENLFFAFYKIAIQFCGNAKQNPCCIAVTAIQNLKSIFTLGFIKLFRFYCPKSSSLWYSLCLMLYYTVKYNSVQTKLNCKAKISADCFTKCNKCFGKMCKISLQ